MRCTFSVAASAPGILKRSKVPDNRPLHVYLADAHAIVLNETAKQYGTQLAGELDLILTYSVTKENRASAPHDSIGPAMKPLGSAHITTVGSSSASLGG